jgi:undecaprenyl-diphosphatase
MTILQSIILGILQGLTEFIPISSTAHLLIAENLLKIEANDASMAFTVLVQIGTLVAVIIYFWKDLIVILRAFFQKPFSSQPNRLAWSIIIATLPALVAGWLLKDVIDTLFSTPLIEAGIRLFITSIALALAEWLGRRQVALSSMKWTDALFIGIAQILAVIPGASRSGITMAAGMARKFERTAAAKFAFLISIPIMLAAGAFEMLDVIRLPNLGSFLLVLLPGFFFAAIVGWLAIKWLLAYLGKRSLYIFSIYCAILGIIAIGLYLWM